jgi:hypothetical protein
MKKSKDPMGLKALDAAVEELRAEAARGGDGPGEPWRSLVAQLDAAHRALTARMDLLRDRYGLLKQSSAQLADEVAWLRDQLDDLASAEDAQEPRGESKGGGEESRRYTDRWKGR